MSSTDGALTIEKILTHNPKLLAMRARRARSATMARGDVVCVMPSRGIEVLGLLVDRIETAHYGVWYDVLVRGQVRRFDAERVSGCDG